MQETCWLPSGILHINCVQLGLQLTVSRGQSPFCQRPRIWKCGAQNSLFFVPFVSVPDKSPRKVEVWFTKFMICLFFTWAAFLFPEKQLLISLVVFQYVKNIIHN